jgi:hypothetical protein
MEKFSLNYAHSIAKIFLSCGLIAENDLINTVHNLMDGTLKLGVKNEKDSKESKSKESGKKETLVS